MGDFFSHILHYLTDNSRKLSSKAIIVICLITGIISLDNIFGFSYNYNINQKLEQVKEINILLNDSNTTREEKIYFIKLKKDIIDRRTFKDHVYLFLTNISFEESKKEAINTQPSVPQPNSTEIVSRNYYWHFATASFIILILIIVLPFIAFQERKNTLANTIATLIVTECVLISLAFLQAKLLSFIPIIADRPWINYLLNISINTIVILAIGAYQNYKEKKGY